MHTHNTYSLLAFAGSQLFYAVVSSLCYLALMFRCLGGLSFDASRVILWGVIAVSCLLGSTMEYKTRRNNFSIFLNLTFAYGLFTAIAYYPLRKSLVVGLLCTAAVTSAVFAALVLCPQIKSRCKRRAILRRRILHVLSFSHLLFSSASFILLLTLAVPLLLGSAMFRPSVKPATQENVSQQTIANNMDTLLLLQDELWEDLTVDEKLNVLQTVANIEQRYLGIPHEMNVGAENVETGTLGYYLERTHGIIINLAYLLDCSSRDALDVVCHEAYHCYQHCLVAIYGTLEPSEQQLSLFYKVGIYAEEFASYDNGEDNLLSYYTQRCESDARSYAVSAVDDYFNQIDEYLQSLDSPTYTS